MNKPSYSQHICHWQLDRDSVFLNHGSFGACPKIVLDFQTQLRQRLETQPLRFMIRELENLYYSSKKSLADFLNVDERDLVFVRNATEGVNTILNSILWNRDDRVLITNHIYPACLNAVLYYSSKYGFEVDEVHVPFPVRHKDEVINSVLKGIRADTRLVILDHITSCTSLVFPVAEIADALSDTHIEILVDGAHAPGAIPLNIEETGVHYYTGNCHKWLCSPKGAAFLWVDPELQYSIFPLSISMINAGGHEFQDRFYWTGTQDPTAFLCVPEAIQTMQKIAGTNFQGIMDQNKQLNLDAARILCDALRIPLPCPEDLLSSMTSFPLPDLSFKVDENSPDPLQEKLFNNYHIEIPVMKLGNSEQRLLRISSQLYNHISQYEYLANALTEIRKL
jgi:isopenicillin-N epimerase